MSLVFFFILISAQLLVWLFTKGLYLFCLCVPAVLHGHWLEGRWVCGWALWQHNNGICLLEDMVWYPSEECQWEWRGNNREVAGTGKKKQNRTSDWKSMTFRIIYMTVIYCGLVLLWGWEGGPFCFVCFFFSYCFICNSYIHPTLHIWTVFQLQSKLKAVFHSVAG